MKCGDTFCECGKCPPSGSVVYASFDTTTIPTARYQELLEIEWMYKDLCS